MKEVYTAAAVYLAIISIISAAVCIFDKLHAIHGGRRVPERTLFLLCVLGGSAAMYITMQLIRHKTLHKRFMLGIPLIICIQLAAAILILKNFS